MQTLISSTGLSARIHTLPGREPFMTATDLAEAYGTIVKALNQAVKRNENRFPEDFMFVLTEDEMEHLKSQNVTSNMANRALPMVFTHAGALMLSAVLKSEIAARISVEIHRAFAAMEKAALDEARFFLTQARIEDTRTKGPRLIVEGLRAGLSFNEIWRLDMKRIPRDMLAQIARGCLAKGWIERLPAGTPPMQADLFAREG